MGSIAETLLLAFEGMHPPPDLLGRIRNDPPAGFTLFSGDNIESYEQVHDLTAALEAANPSDVPLLIATDQEGGQLIAMIGTTPFAGNMALGAAGDPDLTERVGRATGLEMRAAGVNVNYAPIGDLATNPANPSLGIRSFGDQPEPAALHVAAFVRGLRSAGVLSTLKHFPGKGGAAIDSHFGLPVIAHGRDRLERVELVPFVAGLEAGAELVMTGHFAIPGLTERDDLPSTLSRAVLTGLLRNELGFEGAIVTDAFDMGAIAQGAGQVIDAIAAIRAGVDLLLLTAATQVRVEEGLDLAWRRGLIEPARLAAATDLTRSLRRRVGSTPAPDPAVTGSAEHMALARELAERSITLVRDRDGLLPLRLAADARIAAVMPAPRDLTPADTSSLVPPGLASALRRHHRAVDELMVGHPPSDGEIAAVRAAATEYDLLVIGTLSASLDPQQVGLVDELLASGVPTVTVALRTPFDLTVYPGSGTHVCTYGIRQPSLDAMADALFGVASFSGRLPVTVSDECPVGHGLTPGSGPV